MFAVVAEVVVVVVALVEPELAAAELGVVALVVVAAVEVSAEFVAAAQSVVGAVEQLLASVQLSSLPLVARVYSQPLVLAFAARAVQFRAFE